MDLHDRGLRLVRTVEDQHSRQRAPDEPAQCDRCDLAAHRAATLASDPENHAQGRPAQVGGGPGCHFGNGAYASADFVVSVSTPAPCRSATSERT